MKAANMNYDYWARQHENDEKGVWEEIQELQRQHAKTGARREGPKSRFVDLARTLAANVDPLKDAGLWIAPPPTTLPPFAIWLRIRFKLARPLITKDDEGLYPIDNPVRRDWISRTPCLSGPTWKGCLRATSRLIRQKSGNTRLAPIELELFGNEKEQKDERHFHKGQFEVRGTLFESTGLEVINPKSTKKPIFIETIPAGAEGYLECVYHPRFLLAAEGDRANAKDQLLHLADCITATLLETGVGGKRTAGMGTAAPEAIKFELADRPGFIATLQRHEKPGLDIAQLRTWLEKEAYLCSKS